MIERRQAGRLPAKPHTVFREGGALLHEECLTRKGFDGPFTIAYHQSRPHTAVPFGPAAGWTVPALAGTESLLRHHLQSQQLAAGGSPLLARTPLLFNQDVVVAACAPGQSDSSYFSNGDGDDLFFIREGHGVLRSMLGDLAFGPGDYVFVPKGLIHRFELPQAVTQRWLSLELLGGLELLRQFRNDMGQLRMDAPYNARDFRGPDFRGPLDEGLRDVVVKRRGCFHGFRRDESPLDVVGWDGAVFPWVFPISAFQPRISSVHLPPIWHGTFAARGVLVCSFVPRPLDFHPDAIPCPYPHSSVDCDEVIYYVAGQFSSRKGVGPGSVSFHPAGIPHGPHPGSYEGSLGKTQTDEVAVMLDTFAPLQLTPAALGIEDPFYEASFRAKP